MFRDRPLPTVLFALYLVVGVGYLAAGALDWRLGGWLTKPALMPLLALALLTLLTRPGPVAVPWWLVAGLVLDGAGDTALLAGSPGWFLAGMALFGAGHLCYLTALVRVGAVRRALGRPLVLVGYALFWLAVLAALWPHLGGLRLPVAGYSLLLTAMAAATTGLGWRTGLGGGLFLLSDTLIALDLARVELLAGQGWLVMPTYLAGQALIVAYWLWPARRRAGVAA